MTVDFLNCLVIPELLMLGLIFNWSSFSNVHMPRISAVIYKQDPYASNSCKDNVCKIITKITLYIWRKICPM